MTLVESFALTPVSDTESCLSAGGRPTGLTLAGRTLEAQFRTAAGQFLLLATDSCPFEERLSAHLLGPDLGLLEGLTIGRPYTPGVLRLGAVGPGDRVAFSFFAGETWVLTAHPAPTRHPPHRWPTGVARAGGWWGPWRLELAHSPADQEC